MDSTESASDKMGSANLTIADRLAYEWLTEVEKIPKNLQSRIHLG